MKFSTKGVFMRKRIQELTVLLMTEYLENWRSKYLTIDLFIWHLLDIERRFELRMYYDAYADPNEFDPDLERIAKASRVSKEEWDFYSEVMP